MAEKAKKIYYSLEFQTNAEYVEKEIKLINNLLKTSEGTELYSKESVQSLQEILSSLKQTDSILKQMDKSEFFDPSAFKETTKVIANLQKQLTSITKSALKDFAGKDIFDTDEIKLYSKQLETAENKVNDITKSLIDLQKQQERTLDFGVQDAIEKGIRTEKGQKRTSYMGQGTPFGDLKSLKDVNQALKIAEDKLKEIRETTETINASGKNNKTANKQLEQLAKREKVYQAIYNELEKIKGSDTDIQSKIDLQNQELEEQKTLITEIVAKKKEAEAIAAEDAQTNAIITETQGISNLAESYNVSTGLARATDEMNNATTTTKDLTKATNTLTVAHEKSTNAMSGFVGKFVSSQIVFQKLKQLYSETVRTIEDLDAAFNGIAIVSSYSTKEVWGMYDSFSKLAKQTGFTVKEISNLSLEYFRQGRTLGEVIKLTEAAASAAKIAGITAEESVRYLTAAVNGYRLSADQAMMVSDKFAALAATSATDYDGLATALSKVAAQSYSVGVEMDSMLGYIAKVLEVTQEAPENIGTAFKTIFARMSEIKDYGATLEDGMSINKVESALKSVGVSLRDTVGEVRDLDDVLNDLGGEWNKLSKNQKSYIATAVAGTRQQSRFLALMEDYNRTMELVEASSNSLGATYAQQAVYTEGLAFAQNRLNVAWEGFVVSLSDSEFIITVINAVSGLVESITGLVEGMEQVPGPMLAVTGVCVTVITALFGVAAATKALQKNLTDQQLVQLAALGTNKKYFLGLLEVATGTVTAGAATGTFGGVVAATAKAVKGAFMTLSQGHPILLGLTLALTAATAAWAFLKGNAKDAEEKLSETNESIKTVQATLYKSADKKTQINTLIDELIELDDKLIKTEEDTQKMQENLAKLEELDVKGINIGDIQGLKDIEVRERHLTAVNKELNDSYAEMQNLIKDVDTSIETYSSQWNKLDTATQDALVTTEAMKMANTELYSEYMELDSATRQFYENIARTGADKGLLDTSKDVEELENLQKKLEDLEEGKRRAASYGADTSYFDTEIARTSSGIAQLEKDLENVFTYDDAAGLHQMWTDVTKGVSLYDMSIGDAAKAVEELDNSVYKNKKNFKEYADALTPAISSVRKLKDYLGDAFDEIVNSGASLKVLLQLQNSFTSLGLTVYKTTNLLKTFSKNSDLSVGLKVVTQNYQELGLTVEETLDVIKTVNDIRFGDVSDQMKNLSNSILSVGSNIADFKDAIANGWDMSKILELTEIYPELWEVLADESVTVEEAFKKIEEARKQDLISAINHYKESLQIQLAEEEAELSYLIEMLENYKNASEEEKKIIEQDIEDKYKLEIDGYNASLTAFEEFKKEEFAIAEKYALWMKALTNKEKDPRAYYLAKQEMESYSAKKIVDKSSELFKDDTNNTDEVNEKVNAEIEVRKKRIEALRNQLKAFSDSQVVVNNIMKKAASTFEEGLEEAEEYILKLTELFNIQQKLNANDAEMEYLTLMLEDETLAGAELGKIYARQGQIYKENASLYGDMVTEIKSQASELQSKLSKYSDYVDITNDGKVTLKVAELAAADEDVQDAVTELLESYEDLNKEMWANEKAILENELALKKLEKQLQENIKTATKDHIDAEVAFEDLLIDAYRSYLEKKHEEDVEAREKEREEREKALEEEKKYLEDRLQLYQDFFDEQDEQNELASIDEKRQSITNQLSSLEGATDNASIKKRQQLLTELDKLNADFSDKLTDINRNALIETFEEEIKAKEESNEEALKIFDAETAEMEKAWKEYIDNSALLHEEFVKEIGADWELQKQWIKENSEEYKNATAKKQEQMELLWETTRDEVETTRQELQDAHDAWNAYLEGSQKEVKDTESEVQKLKKDVDKVTKALGESEEATKKLKESTKRMYDEVKKPYQDIVDWAQDIAEFTYNAARDQEAFADALWETADAYREAADAKEEYKNAGKNEGKNEDGDEPYSLRPEANTAASGGRKSLQFASGGSTQRTGWHWLDGKPGKPERVLSAQQTEAFDKLVNSITNNNNITNAGVSIGSIKIETPQLNANQDFVNAGRALADALSEAIASRGININQKK